MKPRCSYAALKGERRRTLREQEKKEVEATNVWTRCGRSQGGEERLAQARRSRVILPINLHYTPK